MKKLCIIKNVKTGLLIGFTCIIVIMAFGCKSMVESTQEHHVSAVEEIKNSSWTEQSEMESANAISIEATDTVQDKSIVDGSMTAEPSTEMIAHSALEPYNLEIWGMTAKEPEFTEGVSARTSLLFPAPSETMYDIGTVYQGRKIKILKTIEVTKKPTSSSTRRDYDGEWYLVMPDTQNSIGFMRAKDIANAAETEIEAGEPYQLEPGTPYYMTVRLSEEKRKEHAIGPLWILKNETDKGYLEMETYGGGRYFITDFEALDIYPDMGLAGSTRRKAVSYEQFRDFKKASDITLSIVGPDTFDSDVNKITVQMQNNTEDSYSFSEYGLSFLVEKENEGKWVFCDPETDAWFRTRNPLVPHASLTEDYYLDDMFPDGLTAGKYRLNVLFDLYGEGVFATCEFIIDDK